MNQTTSTVAAHPPLPSHCGVHQTICTYSTPAVIGFLTNTSYQFRSGAAPFFASSFLR
jgi:hypothetical protein